MRSGISGYLFYSRVFSGISGISGIFGYFRVFRVSTGINGYQRVFTGILYIISFLVVVSKILRFDGSSGNLEGIYVNILYDRYYGWIGYGGSVFQWHPKLNIGFAYTPTLLEFHCFKNKKGARLQV